MTLSDWLDRLDESTNVAVLDWYSGREVGRYDGRNSIDICYADCEVMKASVDVSEGVLLIYIDAAL